ncbi:MAG: hypothetical protein ACTHJW_10675 [Streptosporangiaceae bacterium]
MAGPWTAARERQDAGTDLGTDGRASFQVVSLLETGSPSGTRRPLEPPGTRSPLWPPGTRSLRTSRRKTRWAAALLALLLVAAGVLVWATVSVAERGIAGGQAAARRVAGPLVIPPPESAAGLPRRLGAISEPGASAIVTELRQRFGSIGSGLVSEVKKAAEAGKLPGRTAEDITASWTSGLYGQPGHLDPSTSKPAWVMYLGLDATARLGLPADTVGRLMMSFLGPNAKIGPWPVRAGHRGGAANCTIAWLPQTMVGVCGWASDHTIGAVASPLRDTSVAELATLMVRMRYDLQRK